MKTLHCFSISYSFSFVSVTSSSCAALRAVDLGLSSLDTFRARSFGGFPMSCYASDTQLESGELPWERAHFPSKTLFWPQLTFVKKWSFFVTDRGPQLTFLKKRSFFVTDGGPQLTFLKSDHFSSLMGGINWPSCERDHFSSLIPADLLEKWSFFANERGPTDLLDAHIMF